METKHPQWYLQNTRDIERALKQHQPSLTTPLGQTLVDSMNYSLFAGGKRIRPMLALSTFKSLQGENQEHIFLVTSALEMIHTFSLIHDDLPCMDNDDLRRGRPTNHIVYSEGIAVLSGTALCVHAFELISQTNSLNCQKILCSSLGIQGMLAGQAEDLLNENKAPDLGTVQFIHEHKTGKLIQASILMGVELANAQAEQKEILNLFGQKIGYAFQIIDDLLDLEQSTETLGKNAQSDLDQQKMTYPKALGIKESKAEAKKLRDEALELLIKLNTPCEQLSYLTKLITDRIH